VGRAQALIHTAALATYDRAIALDRNLTSAHVGRSTEPDRGVTLKAAESSQPSLSTSTRRRFLRILVCHLNLLGGLLNTRHKIRTTDPHPRKVGPTQFVGSYCK
jgi:hypothetical protein